MPGRSPETAGDRRMNSKSRMLYVFLTFSYPSHLKHLVLEVFLEDGPPEMLSKLSVLAERGIKQ